MTRVFLVVTVTASSILENGDGIQYGVVVGSSGRGKERDVGIRCTILCFRDGAHSHDNTSTGKDRPGYKAPHDR